MKVYLAFGFVFSAVIAIAQSQRCHPGDLSECAGMICSARDTDVGCENGVCTCVVSFSCMGKVDCTGKDLGCELGHTGHCVDDKCICLLDEHHGHGP